MTTISLNDLSFAMIENSQVLQSNFDIQCEKAKEIESTIQGKKLSTSLNFHQAPSTSSCDLSIKKVEGIVHTATPKTKTHPETKEIEEKVTQFSPFDNTAHDIKSLIISNLNKQSRAIFMGLNRKSAHQVHSLAKKELKDKMRGLLATLDKSHYQSEIIELNHFIENPSSPFNQNTVIFNKDTLIFQKLESFVYKIVYSIFKNKINSNHPKLINNQLLMSMVVTQDGWLLREASPELKNNPEIVKAAVSQNGFVLQSASPELRNNLEIVKAAVTQNGLALRYASTEMKNNLEIVKAAVTQNGSALREASPELKNNLEIVKAAVTQNGLILRDVSTEIKNNLEIVKKAVTQNRRAIAFASAEMRNHPEIQQILNRCEVI